MNKIDDIIKLKKLLDEGLISQNDFETLKNNLFEDSKSLSISSQKENGDLNPKIIKQCSNCGNNINSESKHCKDCESNSIDIVDNKSNKKVFIIAGVILFMCFITYFLVNIKSSTSSSNENAVQDSTQVEELVNKSDIIQQTKNETNSNVDVLKPFIGEWRTSVGDYITINSTNELSISNSVFSASLTYKIKNNELILFFNNVSGKLNIDYTKLANKEVGKCFFKGTEPNIEINNEDMMDGMGFSSGKLMSESEFNKSIQY